MRYKSFRKFLLEGGNVFEETTSIPKAFINPTLEKYFEELSKIFPEHSKIFSLKFFHMLGSAGKKDISGDIDLGVNIKSLLPDEASYEVLNSWGINKNDFKETYTLVKSRAKSSTEQDNLNKSFLKLLGKSILERSDKINVSLKKINTGTMYTSFPQFNEKSKQTDTAVQIDWMVGDTNWLKFAYHSDTYTGNVKGLHRTELILAMFNVKGRIFNNVTGVRNKKTNEFEAKSPEEAIQLLNDLYNINLTEEIASNFHTLYTYIMRNLRDKDLNLIFDTYLKILESTRADIPNELQQYWIDNKERLNLTGKFLLDDSKLKQYVNN